MDQNSILNKDIIFDIEVYSNIFTAVFYSVEKDKYATFEVSTRRNDFEKFCSQVLRLKKQNQRMVGFNNYGYDYPVIHALINLFMSNPNASWEQVTRVAKTKSDAIINASHEERFANTIWDNDQFCEQVDLYKIHHFDNKARATSLKLLQFNMRATDIEELPFDPTKPIAEEDIERLLSYNKHDVDETFRFYKHSLEAIALREKLSLRYKTNFLNANDTKIGKTIFQLQLEQALGPNICYTKKNGERKIRQTFRKSIEFKDFLLWYVIFERPEFNAVHRFFLNCEIKGTETKSFLTGLGEEQLGELVEYCDMAKGKKKEWGTEPKVRNLNCIVEGVHYVFGTGGLHACVDPCIVESDSENMIVDLDVVSYYPSLAIVNRVFPEHLSEEFCNIYEKLKKQRVKHKKGTPENAALKLALNGVYGDSNNVYSPFYDPQYTMAITVNGQLLLCVLAEWLMNIDGLSVIQANTDGVTVKMPRSKMNQLNQVWQDWEKFTGLELESVNYSRMFIRDVNNYIAESEDSGDLKRKGCYEYKIEWHQNHSCLVVQKAVEAHLVRGEDVRAFIENHIKVDPYDFYLRTKVPRSSHLDLITDGERTRLQNITRYFISKDGGELMKVMPPLKKNPEKWREISVSKGWKVTVHDKLAPLENVDFDFYEKEALKLIQPLIS